jgi:hypothetical protein
MAICIVQMIQTTGSVRASRTCSHLNCLFWWEVARRGRGQLPPIKNSSCQETWYLRGILVSAQTLDQHDLVLLAPALQREVKVSSGRCRMLASEAHLGFHRRVRQEPADDQAPDDGESADQDEERWGLNWVISAHQNLRDSQSEPSTKRAPCQGRSAPPSRWAIPKETSPLNINSVRKDDGKGQLGRQGRDGCGPHGNLAANTRGRG